MSESTDLLDRQEKTFPVLRELAQDAPLPLTVSGASMVPSLKPGQRVLVEACRFYFPGDVLAFRSADETLVIHRLLGYRFGIRQSRLVTCGDAAPHCDAPIKAEQVIGKIVSIEGTPWRTPFKTRVKATTQFGNYLFRTVSQRLQRVFLL